MINRHIIRLMKGGMSANGHVLFKKTTDHVDSVYWLVVIVIEFQSLYLLVLLTHQLIDSIA